MKECLENEQMSEWEGGMGAVEGAVLSLTPLSSLCFYLYSLLGGWSWVWQEGGDLYCWSCWLVVGMSQTGRCHQKAGGACAQQAAAEACCYWVRRWPGGRRTTSGSLTASPDLIGHRHCQLWCLRFLPPRLPRRPCRRQTWQCRACQGRQPEFWGRRCFSEGGAGEC